MVNLFAYFRRYIFNRWGDYRDHMNSRLPLSFFRRLNLQGVRQTDMMGEVWSRRHAHRLFIICDPREKGL